MYFILCAWGSRGQYVSKPVNLIQNLTGLIIHPSGTLGIWETINVAYNPPGKQIFGGSMQLGRITKVPKEETV